MPKGGNTMFARRKNEPFVLYLRKGQKPKKTPRERIQAILSSKPKYVIVEEKECSCQSAQK